MIYMMGEIFTPELVLSVHDDNECCTLCEKMVKNPTKEHVWIRMNMQQMFFGFFSSQDLMVSLVNNFIRNTKKHYSTRFLV